MFSPEFLKMLHDAAQKNDDDVEPLFEIAYFAKTSFFVILNRNNGLISLDAAIPVNFRTETAGGMFTLPIDRPTTIPSNFLEIVRQVISTISMVLCKIIPGVKLTLVELGTELMEDGKQGTKIQLARELLCANGETHRLPLKYESEGIKKITSIEKLKTAYRTLYSIFDRIAFLLNAYLKLGVVEQKVNFDSIWSRLKEKEAKNIALSALHWIDRDFKEKFGNAGAPHTKKIKMLRNALEHKFVSVHMFSTENEVKIGKDYIYRISEENLIECTMDLLQLIREAVIELTIAIRIEEKQRNPSEKKVLQMSMMEYLDEFKI